MAVFYILQRQTGTLTLNKVLFLCAVHKSRFVIKYKDTSIHQECQQI